MSDKKKDVWVLRPPRKPFNTPMGRVGTMTRSDVLGSILKAWPGKFDHLICLESELNNERSQAKATKVTTVVIGDDSTQTMATPPPAKTVKIQAKKTTRKATK